MAQWLETSIEVVTLLIMVIGLFTMFIPSFPAGIIIWLAALGYGLVTGFNTAGLIFFVLITILTIVGSLADNVLMGARAKQVGASWWSIAVALLTGAIVTFLVPPFGGLIAAPIALYLAEYVRRRDTDQAMEATKAMISGCGWAFIARFGFGVLSIILWAVWAWGNFG